MKKILLAAIAVGCISTNLMAGWVGTIDSVSVSSDGGAYITLTRTSDNRKIGMRTSDTATSDGQKSLIAVALTAQTTGKSVVAWANGTGWTTLKMIQTP